MLLLIISLLALVLGLFSARFVAQYGRALAFFDGFVSIFVGGLVLFHIFPHGFTKIGFWAVPIFFLGIIFPLFLERFGSKNMLGWILIGLAFSVHAFLDGVGLHLDTMNTHEVHALNTSVHAHEHESTSTSAMVWAIIAHRIPMGLFLGFAAIRKKQVAYILAALIGGATILGFSIGEAFVATGIFHALLGGALFHVITGHSFVETHSEKEWNVRILGALCAGGILLSMSEAHSESVFLDIWNLLSIVLLGVMALQIPHHECIACEEPEAL